MNRKKPFLTISSMLLVNIDSWLRNPRTIFMLFFTVCTGYMTIRKYGTMIQAYNYTMNFPESIAYFFASGFNNMALCSLTFLVMVSELPRRIPFQQYAIIRTTRIKWMWMQILYCFFMVVWMMLMLTILAALLLQLYITPGTGWSDTLRTAQGLDEEWAIIPAWIRQAFSPWQACAVAVIPIFCFWFTMVLTVLLFSLIGFPSLGVSVYATILFSSIIFQFESFPAFQPPMTFSTLMRIGYQYDNSIHERIRNVFIGYGVLIACLVFIDLLIAKRMDIPAYALNKD